MPAPAHSTQARKAVGAHPVGPERIDESGLSELITSFSGMKTLVLDKTLAEFLLRSNTGNRRVSRRRVSQLAEQMVSGQFENTGEPIIVSVEGILNNGQHRLLAVMEADVEIEMDVRFGIPRRAFTKTDTGAPRTGADVLAISGVPQLQSGGNRRASAARL